MKKTKKLSKSIKSISEKMDIKQILNNGIQLKDGTFVTGIKVKPYDIWTSEDVFARSIIEGLRYAYNVINFPIYQSFVYIPSSFESLENSLLNELQTCENEEIKEILLDDLSKIDQFTNDNKMVEFFLLIKNKNLKILEKNLEVLKTEFGRSFAFEDLYYLDFLNYGNWLFDLNDNILSKAFYKGSPLIETVATNDIQDSVHDETQDKFLKTNPIEYNMFEWTNSKEHFTINGRFYSIIVVKALPTEYEVGLFNFLGRNQNVKMLYKSDNSNLDLVTHVNKEYRNLEEIYRTAVAQKNQIQAEELKNKIISLKQYSSEMARNRDKTLDISLAFVVSHDDYKEMIYIKKNFIQSLRNKGFTLFSPKMIQEAIFKYFVPIFNDDKMLSDTQKFNIGFPLGTQSYSLTYPYHFSTCEDENGFLYGYEKNMNGRIVFNPYLYKDNEKIGVQENRLSGNIILMGETGSGKSTDLFLFLRYFYRRKTFVMWIDPENKNKKYTLKKGGTYLEFGSDKFMFNVWQLTRVSSDEEDNAEVLFEEQWDTEQAIIEATDTFKNVLVLFSKTITDSVLNIVGVCAKRMYDNFNINGEKLPYFNKLKNTDFPIMQDFAQAIKDVMNDFNQNNNSKYVDACEELLIKITPMLTEYRFIFNGHTTDNIEVKEGGLIGIGTKKLYLKDKNVQDSIYYIIYKQSFNYCLDEKIDSAFVYDEAHTQMKNEQTVDLLDQFTRRSRKYKNITVLGTQEPLDLDKENMLGILNNSTYIITKMLTKNNALATLKRMIGVDDEDLLRIKSFGQGDSHFKCGKKTYYMRTLLTEKEEMDKGNNY